MTKNTAKRQFIDAQLQQAIALSNAANVVNTTSIDLGVAGTSFPVNEKFGVKLITTAGTAANSKNLTIVLQGSNEAAANFVNVAGIDTLVIAAVSTSYPATEKNVTLPPGFAYRYLRASCSGEANGGNAADGTLTVALVF